MFTFNRFLLNFIRIILILRYIKYGKRQVFLYQLKYNMFNLKYKY